MKTWKTKHREEKTRNGLNVQGSCKRYLTARRWRSNWCRLRFHCPSVDGSASTVASPSNNSIDLWNRFLHTHRRKGKKKKQTHSTLNCNSQVLRLVLISVNCLTIFFWCNNRASYIQIHSVRLDSGRLYLHSRDLQGSFMYAFHVFF